MGSRTGIISAVHKCPARQGELIVKDNRIITTNMNIIRDFTAVVCSKRTERELGVIVDNSLGQMEETSTLLCICTQKHNAHMHV